MAIGELNPRKKAQKKQIMSTVSNFKGQLSCVNWSNDIPRVAKNSNDFISLIVNALKNKYKTSINKRT